MTGSNSPNLFVAGFPEYFTKTDLDELFSPYDNVVSSKVMIDLRTSRSRRFGFVRLATDEGAAAATKDLNGRCFDNFKLTVRKSESRENFGEPSDTIFVRGIKIVTEKRVVAEYFSQYGQVVRIKTHSDKKRVRGFEIQFGSVEQAYHACLSCSNLKYADEKFPMFICFYDGDKPLKVPSSSPRNHNRRRCNGNDFTPRKTQMTRSQSFDEEDGEGGGTLFPQKASSADQTPGSTPVFEKNKKTPTEDELKDSQSPLKKEEEDCEEKDDKDYDSGCASDCGKSQWQSYLDDYM